MIDEKIIRKAEEGDGEALLALANAYYDGEDGYKNISKSYGLYRKILAWEPDNCFVLNRIGNCFANGFGVVKNVDAAMKYYKKAADLGYAAAQYNYADGLLQAGDPRCIQWFEKAYENGDADAPFSIALIYKEGKIVPPDNAKVMEYYQKAADKGNKDAMNDLAFAYEEGKLVPKDMGRGIMLMKKAAEAGSGTAANNVSIAYAQGEGVERNMDAALEWAVKAAGLGNSGQLMWFAISYFSGQNGFGEDRKKALELFRIAAEGGDLYAMKNVGLCYDKGYGTEINKLDAVCWYEKAARKGMEEAFILLEDLYVRIYGTEGDRKYIRLLEETAHEGYYLAMVMLHQCYLSGKHVEKDPATAMEYLEDAVACDYGRACYIKGWYLMNGDNGLKQDAGEAVRLWTIAAEKGNGEAMNRLGAAYLRGEGVPKDDKLALHWFEKGADEGNADALFNLGLAYNGNGFAETDYEKALKYFSQAYKAGSPDAALQLGFMYQDGRGVKEDPAKAFEFIQYAADHGDAWGMYFLGKFYFNGYGTQKDIDQALTCYEKAENMGFEEAGEILIGKYASRDEPGIDLRRAFEYFFKKAQEGNAEAQFWLGEAYKSGRGVEQDNSLAKEWFRRAADNGHMTAQYVMGLLMKKEGNTALAAAYWEKAAAAGDPGAMIELARLYLVENMGGAADKERAVRMLYQAADKGKAEALTLLGTCYSKGYGAPKDENKAFLLWQQAAGQGERDAQYLVGMEYGIGRVTMADEEKAIYWLGKAAEQGDSEAQKRLDELLQYRENRNRDNQNGGNQTQRDQKGPVPGSGGTSAAANIRRCRYCREELPENAGYCMKCGKKIKASSGIPFLLIMALPVLRVISNIRGAYQAYPSSFLYVPYFLVNVTGIGIILYYIYMKKIAPKAVTGGEAAVWIIWAVARQYAGHFCEIVMWQGLGSSMFAGIRMTQGLSNIFFAGWFYAVLIVFLRICSGSMTVSRKTMTKIGAALAAVSVLLFGLLRYGFMESAAGRNSAEGEYFMLAAAPDLLFLWFRCLVFLWLTVLLGENRIKTGSALVCVLLIHAVRAAVFWGLVFGLHLGAAEAAWAETAGYLAGAVILGMVKKNPGEPSAGADE